MRLEDVENSRQIFGFIHADCYTHSVYLWVATRSEKDGLTDPLFLPYRTFRIPNVSTCINTVAKPREREFALTITTFKIDLCSMDIIRKKKVRGIGKAKLGNIVV